MTTFEVSPSAPSAWPDAQRSVDLGWITLGYHDIGPAPETVAGAVPIVLLHGAGAGATALSNFVANIGVLAERHRVIALDLPGFGRSDAYVMTTEPRQTVNARAIAGLLDALGIGQADLIGNSLGGGAALATAVDHPDRVRRIVLLGAAGASTPLLSVQPTEGIKALQRVYRDRSAANFRAFFDVMLYDGSTVDDAVLAERARSVRQEQVDAWIASYSSPHRSLAPDLRSVQAPTLILHGRDDRVVAFEGGLSLLSELPNSELHAFNRCGHWVQYEHADRFNELVLAFLDRG